MTTRDGAAGAGAVVVGADGPADSGTAVEWAAGIARHWDADLRVAYVGPDLRPAGWLVELAGRHGGRPEVCPPGDDVGSALLDAAAGARLIVLGSHGHGTGLLAGRIADTVSSGAGCPVAVVRPGAEGDAVVVGVAGGRDADAIGLGADLAAAWCAPLRLVHAWSDVVTHAGERLHRSGEGWQTLRDRARAVTDAARAAAQDRQPGVTVETEIVEGTALRALLDAGRDARALVVGPYGRVPPEGMQLGSSSRALVGFAACTVVVAHGTR
ncbi:universal stress protein [Pseudonocardia endophytica]|uniref:Universal stress protein family protein n=1 Tax=Pseudonocardia endophytica TaxID=401976 RepID=A0A4R1HNH3_PSEEN|nr:universal stress protein [Pseudonocardia endophytica]TCK22741.1 universal stress protein family protein [Pseudonocardia endophytica]